MTRTGRVAGLFALGIGWACGGGDGPGRQSPPATGASERSVGSDGIAEVRHTDPVDRDDVPVWTASPEPVLVVGARDEDGFGLVAGSVWLDDGTIAAADAHARHVRLFAPDGRAVGTVGRRGDGPGEFESIDAMWTVGADSVGLFDLRLMRLSVIGRDGDVGRSTPLELTGVKAHPSPLATLDDGSLVAMSDGRTFRPDDEVFRSDVSLLLYAPDGSIARTIAEIPGREMWNLVWDMGVTPSPVPFGRPTVVAVGRDAVWVGTNEGYVIERLELDGATSLRIRVDRTERPLPPSAIDRYRAAERAKAESPGAAAKGPGEIYTLLADNAPYPDRLPAYDGMIVDDADRLWVRDYRVDPMSETSWLVFEADGGLVARVGMPARFRPTAIRDGRVLGVWTDDLDVEQVRVYVVQ